MKYAIISDIHANESALRRVLADAAEAKVDKIICLGDVVGYGPMPRQAVALVRANAAVVLSGNHDDAVCGRIPSGQFIALAGDAVKRHKEELDDADIEWLKTLPHTCAIEGAIAAHGDFTSPQDFNYIENCEDAAANFNALDAQLMFVGHTHTPQIFVIGQSGSIHALDAQNFTVEEGKRYIVNPGSVGYPREKDGRCESCYIIYDSTNRTVVFRHLPFHVSSVMQQGSDHAKRRFWLIIAALVTIIAVVATCAMMISSVTPTTNTVTVEVPVNLEKSLVLDRKSITLTRDAKSVRANLKLDKSCDPAELLIEFKSAAGKLVDVNKSTVKASASQRIKLPKGTISVHFTVLKPNTDATTKILSFKPSSATK